MESGAQPVSVRVNPAKGYAVADFRAVEWSRWGGYLPQRPSFTLDPHFHSGAYYVQEASSMFVEELFRQAVGDQTRALRLLDLCAAPGGKSTLYASLMPDGLVVANDVVRQRAVVLADNIRRWGTGNVAVTNDDPSHFAALEEWFDVVAVDAPCSGEGMFRKSEEARAAWSLDNVKLCAARQRRILSDIWGSLREGGILIYSTCTFNPSENEENMEWLCREFDCQRVGIEIPDHWGVVRTEAAEAECFHFYPHRVEGEGFFAAVVRKGGEGRRNDRAPKPRKTPLSELDRKSAAQLSKYFLSPKRFAAVGDNIFAYDEALWNDFLTVSQQLSVVTSGTEVGSLFGAALRPSHWLALSVDFRRESVPDCEVNLDEALRFLRRQDLTTVDALAEGVNLLCYENRPIGFVKRIGRRVNSLMPKEIRILM